MKKFAIQAIALVVVSLGAMYFTFSPNSSINIPALPLITNNSNSRSNNLELVKINNTQITVEVADTQNKRNKGLGGRDRLDINSGMLFIFEQTKVYNFWMKGMKFPLDFIFIRDNQIVDIIRSAQPPLPNLPDSNLTIYQSNAQINRMIEVNAGFVDNHQIKVGDFVTVMPIPTPQN